jgi:xanthine dehydrogenase accessory factor
MTSIYESIREIERSGGRAAVCTVVRTRGSVPRHPGAKMIVHPDGRIEGTVGGGELESRVVADALQALADAEPNFVTYAMRDPGAGDVGVCGGEVDVFIEPLNVRWTLVVVGAGELACALTEIGGWLGFRVVLADARAEHCRPEVVPGADAYVVATVDELPDRLAGFLSGGSSGAGARRKGVAVVLTALDAGGKPGAMAPEMDETESRLAGVAGGVGRLFEGFAGAYVGVVCSTEAWASARRALEAAGTSPQALARVRAPCGLPIGGTTPRAVAFAVLSEIVMRLRGGSGEPMRRMGDVIEPE